MCKFLAQDFKFFNEFFLGVLGSLGIKESQDDFSLLKVELPPVGNVSSQNLLLSRSFFVSRFFLPKRFEFFVFFG